MPHASLRRFVAGALSSAALACAPVGARRDPATAPPRDARRAQTATLDSTTARRLCVAPDSVVAGRAPCVLVDQRPPVRVF